MTQPPQPHTHCADCGACMCERMPTVHLPGCATAAALDRLATARTLRDPERSAQLVELVLEHAADIERAYGWMYSEGAGDDMPEELKAAILAVDPSALPPDEDEG